MAVLYLFTWRLKLVLGVPSFSSSSVSSCFLLVNSPKKALLQSSRTHIYFDYKQKFDERIESARCRNYDITNMLRFSPSMTSFSTSMGAIRETLPCHTLLYVEDIKIHEALFSFHPPTNQIQMRHV